MGARRYLECILSLVASVPSFEKSNTALQGTAQTSPSPAPSAAATDEDRGGTKKARQRKRKDPEVVDERTMRMQKRMVRS